LSLKNKIKSYLDLPESDQDSSIYFAPEEKQQQIFLNMLIHQGYEKKALTLMQEEFEKNNKPNLFSLFLYLDKNRIPISPHLASTLSKTMEQTQTVSNVIIFKGLDLYSDLISHAREEFIESLTEKQILIQKKLFDKLNFFKVENLINKEKETLNELLFLQPNSSELLDWKKDLNERWAKWLIENKKRIGEFQLKPLKANFNDSETKTLTQIYNEAKQICSNKPTASFHLSLMFYFFEDFNKALDLLKYDNNFYNSLYKADLLFLNSRYIDCLNLLDSISKTSKDNNIFASTYLSAKCLWALTEHQQAINKLKALVKINPEYASANILLNTWEKEFTI
jgi:hypothetical protein